MAKKLRTIKPKKKKNKIIIVIIILIILAIGGFFTYNYLKNSRNKKIDVKILDSIEKYGYYVDDRDNDLYKKEFNKLKEILNAKEIDTSKYSEQVARLFTIDLYSLKTKVNKYDIGGKSYYYSTKEEMFKTKVMDTLYSTMEDDSYGNRKQTLPDVIEIKTKSIHEDSYIFIDNSEVVDNKRICQEGFELNPKDNSKCLKNVDKVYVVELTWNYEKDMGYDDEGSFVIAPEANGRWSVVEYKPKLGAFE